MIIMKSLKALEKSIIRFSCIEAVVVAFVMLIVFRGNFIPYVLGLIFGLGISVLNFLELSRTLTRAVNMPPSKAQNFTTRKYFVRYIIYGVVIWVSIKSPYLNVAGTIIGILLVKASIFFTQLFNDRNYFLNIINRKEGDEE